MRGCLDLPVRRTKLSWLIVIEASIVMRVCQSTISCSFRRGVLYQGKWWSSIAPMNASEVRWCLDSRMWGKAFPLAGTALPAHPHLRGDPQAVQKLSEDSMRPR